MTISENTPPSHDEALRQNFDSGWRSLSIVPEKGTTKTLHALPEVSFEQVLSAQDPAAVMEGLPRVAVYRALVSRGREDSLDVLPYLSNEQWTAVLDLEAWTGEDLVVERAVAWLELYRSIDPKMMFSRFKSLEEEYQLAMLSPMIDLIELEDFEKLSPREQDSYEALPCHTLFYRLKGNDKNHECIEALIEAGLNEDVNYTYSLLQHAWAVPPHEQQDQLARFRAARVSEDGFVSAQESAQFFVCDAPQELYQKWHHHTNTELTQPAALIQRQVAGEGGFFLRLISESFLGDKGIEEEIKQRWHERMAFLCNGLCSVSRLEASDVEGLKHLLPLVTAVLSLGLEGLSAGDPDLAKTILAVEHPVEIFRFGLALVDETRQKALTVLAEKVPAPLHKRLAAFFAQRRFGLLQQSCDTELLEHLDFSAVEFLKGLFNRYPLMPDHLVQAGVRKIVFRPIASLADLHEVRTQVEQGFSS